MSQEEVQLGCGLSRARCPTYNGHSAPKLEKAILEYLGSFFDPELVREHIAAAELKESRHQLWRLRRAPFGSDARKVHAYRRDRYGSSTREPENS